MWRAIGKAGQQQQKLIAAEARAASAPKQKPLAATQSSLVH
jgi:hypothetical protein